MTEEGKGNAMSVTEAANDFIPPSPVTTTDREVTGEKAVCKRETNFNSVLEGK